MQKVVATIENLASLLLKERQVTGSRPSRKQVMV